MRCIDGFASVDAINAAERGLRALVGHCEACGRPDGVQAEPTRTAYYFEPGEPDPNVGAQLCRDCARDYHEQWDEAWDAWRQR